MGFGNPMASRWCKLYRDRTPAELALEPAVASLGVPYAAQYPFFLFGAMRFFPDFVLLNEKVIIEVDDPSHFTKAGRAKDAERTATLSAAGYVVVRVTNAEALQDPYGVLGLRLAAAGLRLHPTRPT